jgi:hypothetical protein
MTFRVICRIFSKGVTSMERQIAACLASLLLSTGPLTAQDTAPDRRAQLVEAAGLADYLVQVDTICNLAEELVFWQSVAIMGAEHDWTFDFANDYPEAFTYRLYNAVDESTISAIRAAQSIGRNQVISEDDLAGAHSIQADFDRMHALANAAHVALIDGRVADAVQLFRDQTLQLRRDIAISCYSVTGAARERLTRLGLDARLDR